MKRRGIHGSDKAAEFSAIERGRVKAFKVQTEQPSSDS